MNNDAKVRPLYLGKILTEMTDEEHFLTTSQLIQILDERYAVKRRPSYMIDISP